MVLLEAPPARAPASRFGWLDVSRLDPPPRLIVNPRAGHKLGLTINLSTLEAVEAAVTAAGLRAQIQLTESPRHATELARAAVRDGCKLVIAAGGDGTVAETGEGLVHTDAALGILPFGSIMNMARTLGIPRDLERAARTIADGHILAMDVGEVNGHRFLEAGGVGLAAGLFGYFRRLEAGARPQVVLRAALRFVRSLGTPLLTIVADGQRHDVHAAMVTLSNAPFVGAAYTLAPEARIDDGLFDVVVFQEVGVLRVLLHVALVAGGRRVRPPRQVQVFRARHVIVARRSGRRPLPVHADGAAVSTTPARFEILPAALKVLVPTAAPDA